MLLLDLSHTCHTKSRTGIQRVCRSLHRELAADGGVEPLTWDPFERAWRGLAPWEAGNLKEGGAAARKRGAAWTLRARAKGRLRRWLHLSRPELPRDASLIVPELFSPGVAQALPKLFASIRGPRVALFHDAIALKFPELSAPATVARFPAYLRELARFDGVAAVSEDSRQCLQEYWDWLGLRSRPALVSLPLGIDLPEENLAPLDAEPKGPTVLCVSSLEGRKNHLALLEACETLWSEGVDFSLRLIGLAHAATGAAALEKIRALQAAGRPLRYDGPVSDAVLAEAYRECSFTIYPSLMEGFGLPVLESLAHGKPCICSAKGALGESAVGGGCVALPQVDAGSLAAALRRLLSPAGEIAFLQAAARNRRFRTWADYASDLRSWMHTLPLG